MDIGICKLDRDMGKPSQQCQRCHLPLVVDDSLKDLSATQANLLTARNDLPSGKHYPQHNGKLPSSSRNGSINKRDSNLYNSPGESFVVLTDSIVAGSPTNTNNNNINPTEQQQSPTNSNAKPKETSTTGSSLSERLDSLDSLFEALSGKSDIDYPVCSDCADLIRDGLKNKYEEACNERDVYISFLNKLKDQPGQGSEEVEELMKEIKDMEQENEQALEELKAVEREKIEVDEELENLHKESEELAKEEEEFYALQNKFSLELQEYKNEKFRIDSLYSYESNQLQRLQKINVYNDAFCIGHDGYFGVINGLRLGRLREKKVEWSEINAAWGQTLLLLATVIHKLNFKLVGYRLRPLGSVSKIEKLEADPKTDQPTKPLVLELFSSGDYSFERILNHKRLDSAMVAFLHVLKQVGEYVESLDPTLKLPYVIDQDKIGGCSIRLSMNSSNESWTTACKYVLTNAKWILAYASTR